MTEGATITREVAAMTGGGLVALGNPAVGFSIIILSVSWALWKYYPSPKAAMLSMVRKAVSVISGMVLTDCSFETAILTILLGPVLMSAWAIKDKDR